MRSLSDSVQRVLLHSWLSYRGLFTWLNPLGYVSTRLLTPLFLAVLFGALARQEGGDPARVALGSGLYAALLSSLTGTALSVANERRFGTMGAWLSSPGRISGSVAARALPHLVDSVLSATFTVGATTVLLDLPVSGAMVGQFGLAVLPAGLGGVALGVISVGVGIGFRDVFTVPNIFQALILVTSGAVFPTEHAPGWLLVLGRCLPLGNAVGALNRSVATGHADLSGLAVELVVDVGYGLAGYLLIKVMLRRARLYGSFDLS